MESLPTIKQVNKETFHNLLLRVDPELYLIKMALEETGFNPNIVPKIIRGLSNLAVGTGYGKVQIFMQARVVTQVKSEESTEINQKAVVDK